MAQNTNSKGKGKSNKNQTAKTRAQSNAALSSQPLRQPRVCNDCGGAIRTLGQLETIKIIDGGKSRLRARHKGGCPKSE